MTNHTLRSTVASFSLLLSLTACTEHVVGGVEPDDTAPTALAILGKDLPADPHGFLAQAQITVQPDTLYVFIGNTEQTCASPFLDSSACDPDPQWQMVLGIPSALQTAGSLTLPATGVDAALALAAGGGPGDTCAAGVAPKGLTGDVAITSIDDAQVTLQFTAVEPQARIGSTPPSSITATFKAVRCP